MILNKEIQNKLFIVLNHLSEDIDMSKAYYGTSYQVIKFGKNSEEEPNMYILNGQAHFVTDYKKEWITKLIKKDEDLNLLIKDLKQLIKND